MNFEATLPYLAGPGAAVICLMAVGWAAYRLAVKYLIPVLEGAVARHMAELEKANARHEKAVADHLDHIESMGVRYDKLAEQHATEYRAILDAVERVSDKIDSSMKRSA